MFCPSPWGSTVIWLLALMNSRWTTNISFKPRIFRHATHDQGSEL